MFHEPIRKDRNEFGGGVAFYVSSKLHVVERRDLRHTNLGIIYSKIHSENKKFIVGVIYRPPSLLPSIRDNFHHV